MTNYSVWSPYEGTAAIALTIGLLVVAGLLAVLGWRLRRPLGARSAGPATGVFIVIAWFLCVLIQQWVTITYGLAIAQQAAGKAAGAANPITKFTLTFAVAAFIVIAVMTRRRGWKVAIISGIAGAGAGPVMFEFPFDWIIMFHLNVPAPVNLYRWLYFLPLFLFIVLTLSLSSLSPAARLRRGTLFALAGMFAIWAVWALTGFGYPDAPLPTTLNVVSKLAAAVAGVFIFVPDRELATTGSPLPAATHTEPPPTPDPGLALAVRDLRKSYPGFTLADVSFALPTGHIMGFVGQNGAGKTTTIRLILNMARRTGGSVQIFGLDNVRDELAAKQEIAAVFDEVFFVDTWRVSEVETGVRGFYDRWDPARYKGYLNHFELPLDKRVKDLSRGMKMKLMLAVAMSHDAKLLILDEPTSGLDPVARDELLEILRGYVADGQASVFFSTHITSDLERVADYITLIDHGHIFYTGTSDLLLEHFRIVTGGPGDLTDPLRDAIIGLTQSADGFTGMIRTDDLAGLPSTLATRAPNIDEILIHISKQPRGTADFALTSPDATTMGADA